MSKSKKSDGSEQAIPISAAELERAIAVTQAEFEATDFDEDEEFDDSEDLEQDEEFDLDEDDQDFDEEDFEDDEDDEDFEIEVEVEESDDDQDESDDDSDEDRQAQAEAALAEAQPEAQTVIESFADLELKSPLRRAIQQIGFVKPTPIQAQALPLLLDQATDFMGQAMTGTGKTAAYVIPILQAIKPAKRALQALILCPTRELALQVSEQIEKLGQHLKVEVLSIYGGADHGAQLRGLREGAPIAVATPGRLLEHIRRGTVNLENLTHLVLDEADQMMSLGFREEVEAILAKRPAKRCHIWLLSATLSKEVRQISEKWLKHPAQVILNAAKDLSSDLSQQFFATQESNKPEVLCKLLDAEDPYGLIFCQTKALASDLSSYLAVRGFLVACLHGDKDQAAREAALNDFRQHKIQLLVCTDVAARGLDIPEVTHVINFSLPRESDVYLHRVGRTARSGKAGKVLNLVSPAQRGQIRHLEDVLGTEIPEGQIPTRRELGSKKMQALLARFQAQEPFKAMDLLDEEWVEVLGNVSRREIAGRFISMLMPEIFGQDPAGKQLLGKKPKPESDYDDDEDDPEFERMVEALKAAKAKKPYQKMAPETKLAARAHQHETRDKYSPRPIRPQSEKTSRELRRLDAVDFGDKPRSHRRDDEDAKPRRFVRVERSDKDAAKGGFKGQGRSSRHEDDFKQERSSRYGQGTQKRYRDSDSRSSGRPSDERSSYRGGRSEGGERAYGRRENAEGRYGKSSGRYERAERSDSSASGRREERPYAKGTGKSFGKGGKTEGKSFGKGGGKSFGSGKGGFGKSSGKGPDRGPKKPGRR